jgi:transposase
MRGRWELGDSQWELLEPLLRPKRRTDGRGRPWQDMRAVLNGILWVLGTGAQCHELPNKYPPSAVPDLPSPASSSGCGKANWKAS